MTVQYGPRPAKAWKLDPWKATIDAKLSERPKVSAAALFREVKAAGYPGGYGQVKRYVRKVRREMLNGESYLDGRR